MKLKLILNPIAVSESSEKRWFEAIKYLDSKKAAYDLDITSKPGDATHFARRAVLDGFDRVVAVGGDGTAAEVASGLIGSDVTFGVIPAGEANDFHKMLGLSNKNIKQACDTILDGTIKTIDVGMVNDRYFINVVGIGVDGEITERKINAPPYLRGFVGYYIESLLALISYKPKKVTINLDGASIETTIVLVSIGNGRYCGGGFMFTPAAEIDDGILDICLIKFFGKLYAALNMAKVPKGQHVNDPSVTMLKAKEIDITSSDLLTAHVDGEIMKAKEFKIKILPHKLKVLYNKEQPKL